MKYYFRDNAGNDCSAYDWFILNQGIIHLSKDINFENVEQIINTLEQNQKRIYKAILGNIKINTFTDNQNHIYFEINQDGTLDMYNLNQKRLLHNKQQLAEYIFNEIKDILKKCTVVIKAKYETYITGVKYETLLQK